MSHSSEKVFLNSFSKDGSDYKKEALLNDCTAIETNLLSAYFKFSFIL